VLEKSDEEAFAWAHRAAEAGLAKAEFATGYFLERGVGCKRDGLEAWKYYVRAADHGDERAITRLKAGKDNSSERSLIAAAESEKARTTVGEDDDEFPSRKSLPVKGRKDVDEEMKGKDCIVM
jgi:TPR repeat protein